MGRDVCAGGAGGFRNGIMVEIGGLVGFEFGL